MFFFGLLFLFMFQFTNAYVLVANGLLYNDFNNLSNNYSFLLLDSHFQCHYNVSCFWDTVQLPVCFEGFCCGSGFFDGVYITGCHKCHHWCVSNSNTTVCGFCQQYPPSFFFLALLVLYLAYFIFWCIRFCGFKFFCCDCTNKGNAFFFSVYRFNGVEYRFGNLCIIFLLFLFFCIKPTRSLVVGSFDSGRFFSNGSVTLYFQGFSTNNTCSLVGYHGSDCISKGYGFSACCTTTPPASPCLKDGHLSTGVTYFDTIHGGGWFDGCFCFGGNIYGGCCLTRCSRVFKTYECNNRGPVLTCFCLYFGNQTKCGCYPQGTHNVSGVLITLSGLLCTYGQLKFSFDNRMIPYDLTGCPRTNALGVPLDKLMGSFSNYFASVGVSCPQYPECDLIPVTLTGRFIFPASHVIFVPPCTTALSFFWTANLTCGNCSRIPIGCSGLDRNAQCFFLLNGTNCCYNNTEGQFAVSNGTLISESCLVNSSGFCSNGKKYVDYSYSGNRYSVQSLYFRDSDPVMGFLSKLGLKIRGLFNFGSLFNKFLFVLLIFFLLVILFNELNHCSSK